MNHSHFNKRNIIPRKNDGGFNIEITSNSPTPNTIPAQINTEQQIKIGAGPYSVTDT